MSPDLLPGFKFSFSVLLDFVVLVFALIFWPCSKIKGHFCNMEAGPDVGLEHSPSRSAGPGLWLCSAPLLDTSSVGGISGFLNKERSILFCGPPLGVHALRESKHLDLSSATSRDSG